MRWTETEPVLSRRALLAGFGALALPRPSFASGPEHFLAMRDDATGRHYATRFDARGRIAFDLALPDRGHGIALTPDRRGAVAVARRPGHFLQVFDPATGAVSATVDAAEGFFF